MNPDDKSLFLDAMEDVQPMKRCSDIHWQPMPKRTGAAGDGY
jgi:DNA-nicking Smr family endonuclease